MPRINKIYGPTSTIKLFLDHPSTETVENYDPEVAMNGLTNFLEKIGISYVLLNQETVNIPQVFDRIAYIMNRYQEYQKEHPELSHVNILFI